MFDDDDNSDDDTNENNTHDTEPAPVQNNNIDNLERISTDSGSDDGDFMERMHRQLLLAQSVRNEAELNN